MRGFGSKKGVSFGGVLSSTTCAKLVWTIQWIVGLLYPGEDKSKEKFYCIGLWALPTAKGLNFIEVREIYVPQSDIVCLNS